MKNADTNAKMLGVNGVNAGSNVVGTLGNIFKGIFGGKGSTKGSSAKGSTGAVVVPSPTSAGGVSKAGKVLPTIGAALAPSLAGYGTAAGLALPVAYYGIGKYLEGKGYGKTIDEGPNKNELRHRTGGLGNSSTKTKTSNRRHN